MYEMILKMWGEGLKSFYKGVTLNLIKSPIASGTSWMIKNSINKILDKKYTLWFGLLEVINIFWSFFNFFKF